MIQKIKVSVTETAIDYIEEAVPQIQSALAERDWNCTQSQIEEALVFWLESSIESLAEDALYHCVEGDVSFARNRDSFFRRLEILALREQQAQQTQEMQDYLSAKDPEVF